MKRNGFTLIELLVVIGIIGVLTGLATFNFQQARQRTRDVQRKNDLKQLQQALELYKNDQNPQHYPQVETYLELRSEISNYVKKWPNDPKEVSQPGTWTNYTYESPEGLRFVLNACLENGGDADGVGVCNTTGVIYQLTQP